MAVVKKFQGTPVSYLVEKPNFSLCVMNLRDGTQSRLCSRTAHTHTHEPKQALTGTHTIDNPGEAGSCERCFLTSIFLSLESHTPLPSLGCQFLVYFFVLGCAVREKEFNVQPADSC